MVRKVHKYANGGQVKDHYADGGDVPEENRSDYRYPKPKFMDAVKDRVKGMFTSGAAGKAAKQIGGRKKQIDDAVDDMS